MVRGLLTKTLSHWLIDKLGHSESLQIILWLFQNDFNNDAVPFLLGGNKVPLLSSKTCANLIKNNISLQSSNMEVNLNEQNRYHIPIIIPQFIWKLGFLTSKKLF